MFYLVVNKVMEEPMPDRARIYKADERTLRIRWPDSGSATSMAPHDYAFTVIFRQDAKIRRDFQPVAGSGQQGSAVAEPKEEVVRAGIPYSRKGPLAQSVVNLTEGALDADKDERPNGDKNPDDTIVQILDEPRSAAAGSS